MNRKWKCSVALFVASISLAGCETNDRLLFATKTNYGLDIDSKPPTAEITIARRELAIAPTFQDADKENTLPLLASFGLSGLFLDPEITSRFAGGEAAVFLAEGPNVTHLPNTSSLCLSKKPDMLPAWKNLWFKITRQDTEENTRDFYFATDTSFGLKAAWDGSTGPYPSTVKLGYNRKELAFPPIFAHAVPKGTCLTKQKSPSPTVDQSKPGSTTTQGSDKNTEENAQDNDWIVTIPSFVASLNNSSYLSSKERSGVDHVQFIATGKAASEFVKRREVNSAMNKAMYPQNDLLIAPETVGLTVNGKQTFEVTGGTGQVRFTLMHDGATAGAIDPSTGAYTAGATPGTYSVGASDKTGKTAVATITVYPQLDITPKGQSVAQGKTLQFSATGGVPPLTFTTSDKNSGIDQKGLYTAGRAGITTDTVTVTDSASPPNAVKATVNVQ